MSVTFAVGSPQLIFYISTFTCSATLIDAAAIEVPVVLQIPQEHVTDPQEVAPKPEVPAVGVPAAVPKIFQVLQEAFGFDPAAAAVPERDEEFLIYGPPPSNHRLLSSMNSNLMS